MNPNRGASSLRTVTKSGRNAPRQDRKIPKKLGVTKQDYELTPVRIQEILNNLASNRKPDTLFLSEEGSVFARAVGEVFEDDIINFLILSDKDLYDKFFQEFNQEEFAAHMDFFTSEFRAMVISGTDTLGAISVVIGHIKHYMSKLRSDVVGGDEPVGREAYTKGLIDELEKRLTEELRDKLESI